MPVQGEMMRYTSDVYGEDVSIKDVLDVGDYAVSASCCQRQWRACEMTCDNEICADVQMRCVDQ